MGKQVQVGPGLTRVWLYPGGVFDGDEIVILRDDEYDALSVYVQSHLVVLDAGVADPDRNPVEGGSGLVLDGDHYYMEINNGLALPVGNTVVTWDTIYGAVDNYTDYAGPAQFLELPVGIYAADWEIDVDSPDTDRMLFTQLAGTRSSVSAGQTFVSALSSGGWICGSGILVVPSEGVGITQGVALGQRAVDAAEVGTTDLNVSWASLSLRKIS